ncbi:delta-lactam-biosynthetic de-N-acetylase [Mesobacillus subterraneus]|uniref:Delta-lactam-biosynthetic de-N-acetylase n=1 Tax=Mesobacillus subterraneus TaxID=285983 RepID=A0A427TQR2_9BACI|nr:delta-lactam-biosynthetic de-N-acetylase [Mesobacillus subterraneus]RSD26672.1 delta-lactam-biosynthetic de-N-acetylase [Mesobacillus subterraneus]
MKTIFKLLIALNILLLFALPAAVSAEENSNSPLHWGFKKGRNGRQADAGRMFEVILEDHGAVYKGDKKSKDIYLTFDNGYENGYTEKILDTLREEKVPAAFFVTGHYLESAPELVSRMANEGHIIGNHSWHHPDMTKISDEKIMKELEMVRAETERITGKKDMAYLRPPRGIFSERTMAIAREAGYTHVFWSLAFVDWNTDQQRGAQYSYDKIMSQIHPGAVLLLHTVSKDNADALGKVIRDLKEQGYTFKSLDDLMLSKNGIKHPMMY